MNYQKRIDRRGYLTSLALLGATSLAGCTGVTEQRFEADPVVLPPPHQAGLVLGERLCDSSTVTRSGPSGNVEVTATSQFATYGRAAGVDEYGAVRTAVGHYLERHNDRGTRRRGSRPG